MCSTDPPKLDALMVTLLLYCSEAEGGSPKELDIKTEFSSSPVACDAAALPPPLEDNPYTISISVPAQD